MKRLHHYTLLYAEDEEKIRNSYADFLSSHLKEVYVAKEGAEALELYREHRPDILLSDILMPKIEGLDLVKTIRREDDLTRVIMMTAYSDREKLLKATELNITKYLIKPIRRDELLGALVTAVEQLEKRNPPHLLLADSFIFDKRAYILMHGKRPLPLSRNEALFLSILAEDTKRFFTLEKVSERFYLDFDKDLSIDALKSLIKRLRKKIPSTLLENRFGIGYRLVSA
ncbi:response regulator transcription factor [Hydrogenimonas sp.]